MELDALYALATDVAKKLMRDAVESNFDEGIFEETREEEIQMKEDVKARIQSGILRRYEEWKSNKKKG